MTKLESAEKFNTSRGLAFLVKGGINLKQGQSVNINGEEYRIKKIIFPTTPDNEKVAIIVET